jgi:L-fuculose-phosphate aldolase
MLPYIPKYDALLMANHGAVCYGDDLFNAYFKMETLEHVARITLVAELLGGPKVLPRVEVDKLFDSRSRYGIMTRSGAEPGCPIVAEDIAEGITAPGTGAADRISVTREELIALVEEAVRARG